LLTLPGAGYADDEGEQELIMLYERTLELLDQSQRALLENGKRLARLSRRELCALQRARRASAGHRRARGLLLVHGRGESAGWPL